MSAEVGVRLEVGGAIKLYIGDVLSRPLTDTELDNLVSSISDFQKLRDEPRCRILVTPERPARHQAHSGGNQ